MAVVASMPPPMAKRMDEDRRLLNQLESQDPTERWAANQRITNRNMERFSDALIQQARANAKALQEQERQAERAEQEFYASKYKIIK